MFCESENTDKYFSKIYVMEGSDFELGCGVVALIYCLYSQLSSNQPDLFPMSEMMVERRKSLNLLSFYNIGCLC